MAYSDYSSPRRRNPRRPPSRPRLRLRPRPVRQRGPRTLRTAVLSGGESALVGLAFRIGVTMRSPPGRCLTRCCALR